MEMYQLRYLVKAIELGNIGRAAEHLNVSQPAISRSFKRLEEEVKAKLFIRTPAGVKPTEFGEALFIHAKSILNQTTLALSEIESIKEGQRDQVKVGVSDTLHSVIVADLIELWKRKHPLIDLSIDRDIAYNLLTKTRAAEVDFSISTFEGLNFGADLAGEEIFTDKLFVYVRSGHPLARKRRVSLHDIASSEWAILGLGERVTDFLDVHFSMRGLPAPRLGLRASALPTIRSALLGSDLVAILPRYFIQADVDKGHVVKLSLPELELVLNVGLILPTNRSQNAAQAAISDLVRSICIKYAPPEAVRLR